MDSTLNEQPNYAGPTTDGNRPVLAVKMRWLGILTAALAIGVWAQLSIMAMLNNDWNANLTPGLLGFAIAGSLLVFVERKVDKSAPVTSFTAILPARLAPPPTLWITNLALSFILIDSIDLKLPPETSYLFLGLWLANILLLCWNVMRAAEVALPSQEQVKNWVRTHWQEIVLVLVIGVAALLVRTIDLTNYPYAFINDEGEIGMEAIHILNGEKDSFFATGWSGQPLLSFLPGAVSVALLGRTVLAIRIFSALQGALAVVFVYLLAREAFDRPTGILAACLLAALPWHVHFSRLGVMNIADSFFSAGALWLTYRALRRGHFVDYLLAGLMTGLALYTYLGSRLVVAMVIGVIGYAALRQRDFLKTHLRHIGVLVLAFFVVASPMIVSFAHHYDEFMGRLNTEGIFSNNQLAALAQAENMQPIDVVRNQLQASAAVFIGRPGPLQFFDTPRPYLLWWAAVFLGVGMAYALWHLKEVRYIMLLGWFWSPIIIGSAFTMYPPSNQRMLGAAPAAALLIGLGLWKFAQAIRSVSGVQTRWVLAACIVIMGFTAWQDGYFYFAGEYRTDHHFENPGEEFSYEVGLRANQLGPDYRLFVIGDPPIVVGGRPQVFVAFADFDYLAHGVEKQDFNQVTPETIASLPRDRGLFVTAIPERVDDLKLVAQQIPGGEWIEVPRRHQEGINYYAYIVPAATNP